MNEGDEMKKKDIYLLLIVYSILAVICSWKFIFLKNEEKATQVKSENEVLETRLSQLEALASKEKEYEKETLKLKEKNQAFLNYFPSATLYEDEIMYIHYMENISANDIVVPTLSMKDATEIPYIENLSVEGYELKGDSIKLYESKVDVSFSTTYNGLKNFIKYIYGDIYRKSISSISLMAGADGLLSGSMCMEFYHLEGGDKPYIPIEITSVKIGTDNIFGVINYINSSAASVIEDVKRE